VAPVLDEFADEVDHTWRQRLGFCAQDFRQCFSQRHEALPHGDAALEQKAANLIGYARALPDQRERTRCSASKSICSGVLIDTNCIVGRCTASAIASASR